MTRNNSVVVTLYAPIMEPFGFVPLESMACGTPVVGVREAGVRESVVHGVTGLLVEREPAELARAVEALLTDPNRAADMGRCGRACVQEHWTWERTPARLEGYLTEAAGRNR
jgi:glycosyltransferase involved in cell wall biosynthesis